MPFSSDENVTAVPCFQTSACPCGPGYVILSKFRSFKRWFMRKPPYRMFTECLWDYSPSPSDGSDTAPAIPIHTLCDRPAATFRFIVSRSQKNETKTIRIVFQGKRVTELDLQKQNLLNMKLSTMLFGKYKCVNFSPCFK